MLRGEMVRTQVILTPEEHNVLRHLSKEKDVSIASLVREAVEKAYIKKVDYQERLGSLKRLAAREGKVSDWPTMKREIVKGFIGGRR